MRKSPITKKEQSVRFWAKVAKDRLDGCWLWTAYRNAKGYGEFNVVTGRSVLAHRYSFQLEHGAIPDGLCVLHRCDTPACVNPEHLFVGSLADNNADIREAHGPLDRGVCVKFTIVDAPQRSDAWFKARLGRLTGSRAGDMMTTLKSSVEAAARRDLRIQLIVERLTGRRQEDGFVNTAIQRGIDFEATAIAAYEAATGQLVQPVGFCAHDELLAGCSPDGQVEDFAGIVEVKCPKSATHLRYLRSGGLPADYRYQVLHNLWITGARWCEFISYDDRFSEPLRLFVVRYTRDEAQMRSYELSARIFLREVEKELAEVENLITAGAERSRDHR